jgi:hypothetical protein
MNQTLRKILLYFAIAGAVIVAVLWIISIWWNINGDIIWRTLLTYIVLFLAILSISGAHNLYDKFKNYPELASIWNWLLIVSVAAVALFICMEIWHSIVDSDLIWKIIATIGVINFAMLIIVFSMDKWWSKSVS